MSRTKIGPCPQVVSISPDSPAAHPKKVSLAYTVRVITPILSGGSEPMHNDIATLIRGPSVRGHLRFWWRATRGAVFSAVADLRKREATANSCSLLGTLDMRLTYNRPRFRLVLPRRRGSWRQ